MNENLNKFKFYFKWYTILVAITEIITIFLTLMPYFFSSHSHDVSSSLSEGLLFMAIWLLNSLIISISSIIFEIEYKKYKANLRNIGISNILLIILSSILIGIGLYVFNFSIYTLLEAEYFSFASALFYIGAGIALIFPVVKPKSN